MTGTTCYSRIIPPSDVERSVRVNAIHKLFGLAPNLSVTRILDQVDIPHQGITLIVGPSGAGKSTLLDLIAKDTADARSLPIVPSPDKAVIDLVDMGVPESIQWLGRFGLGEARLLTTPYCHLSDGQKIRVRLALLMVGRPSCIILDEFLSVLDRLTAKLVSFNLQKMCRQANVTAFLATAHEDLTEAIAPDHLITIDLGGSVTASRFRASAEPYVKELDEVLIDKGTPDDYRSLARFHYIEHLSSEAPQTHADWQHSVSEIWTASFRGRKIGVALYARPVPDLLERLPYFRVLNERTLVLLRIVLHPMFRGVGLARRLLNPTLGESTRCLVACSALGLYFPFHLTAGFVPVPHPRNRRYAEHDDLEHFISSAGAPHPDALNRYSDAQLFYDTLALAARTRLRRLVTAIALRQNVEYCQFLAHLVGVTADSDAYREELNEFFSDKLSSVAEDQFGTILSEVLHIPVQGFVKAVNGFALPKTFEMPRPRPRDSDEAPPQ